MPGNGTAANAPKHADFRVAVFDMDGVVTRTAELHAAAWKALFDAYLSERESRGQVGFPLFRGRTRPEQEGFDRRGSTGWKACLP